MPICLRIWYSYSNVFQHIQKEDMGSQMSFGDLKFQGQRKKTRREAFLERMDAIVVWDSWIALVDTSYH